MPNELKSELQKAVGQARGIVEDLQRLGLGEVFSPPVQSFDPHSEQENLAAGLNKRLSEIEAGLVDCKRCSLAEKRNKIVFGAGNPNAKIVFIGDEPGPEEDQAGVPFVDEAGQLLDRILNAMGMTRNEVYLCTVVKCSPLHSRKPVSKEIATCEPFLIQQLEAIRPEIIVSLGTFTSQILLQSDLPITKMRGQWQQYQNIPLMPTFHPAYLLQNGLAKREVWDDMKAVLKRLNNNRSDPC